MFNQFIQAVRESTITSQVIAIICISVILASVLILWVREVRRANKLRKEWAYIPEETNETDNKD